MPNPEELRAVRWGAGNASKRGLQACEVAAPRLASNSSWRTRRKFYDMATADKMLIAGFHYSFPPRGTWRRMATTIASYRYAVILSYDEPGVRKHPNIILWEGCACPGIAHRPAIDWLFSIHVVPMAANLYYSFATLTLGSASSDSGTGSGSRHTYQRGR